MRIILKWPKCEYDKFEKETVFWVEASEEELENVVYQNISDASLGAFIKYKSEFCAIETNEFLSKGKFYFLVNRDFTQFNMERWSFPYGGMWNAGNPFRKVKITVVQDRYGLKDALKMMT